MVAGPGNLLGAERRQTLIRVVQTDGRVQVATAAAEFGTSTETIRKDLVFLEKQGLLKRVHGGAIQAQLLTFEPDVYSRTEDLAEKRRIALRALEEVPQDGAIFIDAGSTTRIFAELLTGTPGLRVFTNALNVAVTLARRNFLNCHTLGGRIRPKSLSEVGPVARAAFEDYRFDVAFVGTNAVSFDRGLCTPDPEEAAIKRLVINSSDRVLLLADHTKFGCNSVAKYADFDEIDLIITGVELEEQQRASLTDSGVKTVFA